LFYDNNHVYVGNFDASNDKSFRSDEKGRYYMLKGEHPVMMEGVFKDDHIVKGTITRVSDKKKIYDGDFHDDEISNGTYHYDSEDVYVGQFSKFQRNGKGKYTYKSGEIYDGDWKDGKKHGIGTHQRSAGAEVVKYKWENDVMGEVIPSETKK